ncbi:tRNA pseudouridine(13) synthase TruD [Cardiobacteriaceae bacterium TAE3-ERU3]|nr:tRNA pseudouridine(13) synthase TruD [Cardiobacteriaceae bacterium TAE3-ERU3]
MHTSAVIKTKPEDFVVDEIIDFPLSGDGEHLWCYVEKRGMNTAFLKREWSRLLDCPGKLISHSGLKDRHAVTRQWLCLPARDAVGLPDSGEGWQIIEHGLHQKKLRIGTHRRNNFTLYLRQVSGDKATIDQRLAQIKAQGFANSFGEQRFGRNNLDRALRWVERSSLPKKRDERAQTLSTLRAWLFNLELEARRELGNAGSLVDGDYAMLAGSNSHFIVKHIDEELLARCASGDIAPAGILVGKSKQQASGRAQAIRKQAYAGHEAAVDYLQHHCDQDCRALVVQPSDMSHEWLDNDELRLSFSLPRGSFATALLADVFDELHDDADTTS